MPTVATSEGGGSMPAPNSKMPKGVMGAPLSTLCAAPARVSAAAATRIFGMQRDVGDMKGLSWVRGGKNRNLSHKRRDRGAPRRLPNGIETHGGLCGCRARYAGAMNFPDRIEIRELVTGGDPAAPPVASIVVLHGLCAGAPGLDQRRLRNARLVRHLSTRSRRLAPRRRGRAARVTGHRAAVAGPPGRAGGRPSAPCSWGFRRAAP